MNTPSKPITIQIQETKAAIADIVNRSNLPAWVVRDMFSDFFSQMQVIAQQEYEHDLALWNEAQKGLSENELHEDSMA